MLNDQIPNNNNNQQEQEDEIEVREIHALTSPSQQQQANNNNNNNNGRGGRPEWWETSSHRSSTLSVGSSEANLSDQLSSMSREFSAMVAAGSTLQNDSSNNDASHLSRIGEEELEETNPLAIVPDTNPLPSPIRPRTEAPPVGAGSALEEVSLPRVKKEEVESKVSAWQTAEIAKVNNRYKRQEAIINGWESEEVERATTWLKKIERKLEEQRARALEKMQNDVAKARQKAEEKRASAEAKRGTKVARILEAANFMKAVGRSPSKKSFF